LRNLLDFDHVIMVDWRGTKVTDARLEHLKGMNQVHWVYLAETDEDGSGVTDAGLENLSGLSQLHTLDVRHTRVTDEGVKKLQQALPNCYILRWRKKGAEQFSRSEE
jgi:hypothetical protein